MDRKLERLAFVVSLPFTGLGFISFLSDLKEIPEQLGVYATAVRTVFVPLVENTVGLALATAQISAPLWLQSYVFMGLAANLSTASGILSIFMLPDEVAARWRDLTKAIAWRSIFVAIMAAPFVAVIGILAFILDTMLWPLWLFGAVRAPGLWNATGCGSNEESHEIYNSDVLEKARDVRSRALAIIITLVACLVLVYVVPEWTG